MNKRQRKKLARRTAQRARDRGHDVIHTPPEHPLYQALCDMFPWGTPRVDNVSGGLQFVGLVHDTGPGYHDRVGRTGRFAVLRLVVWDHDENDVRTVANIKEQAVDLGLWCTDAHRLDEYHAAAERVFDDLDWERCLPEDLFPAGKASPLLLKRARTAGDFEKALRTKGRCGKHLR
jgi:hypothetical protein